MVSSLKRYGIALAGVVFHLMIGGGYAWSVFTKPIVRETGWRESSVAFAFSLAIFFLGMSAAFMGRLVEKCAPPPSALFPVFFTAPASPSLVWPSTTINYGYCTWLTE